MGQIAKLALEDGTVFTGIAFGAMGEVDGEVCFNTSMTGYQEILTDPSYRGQIVTMTYPEIGNYGVNAEDVESHKPHLAGFVVRELSRPASNFRADGELRRLSCPARHRRPGRHRHPGPGPPHAHSRGDEGRAVDASISTTPAWWPRPRPARAWSAATWCARSCPTSPSQWTEALSPWTRLPTRRGHGESARLRRCAARRGAGLRHEVEHRPASVRHGLPRDDPARHGHGRRRCWPASPTACFFPTGRAIPSRWTTPSRRSAICWARSRSSASAWAISCSRLACGAKTYKLKFGHRGANQPVLNHATGRVEITTQNHGFAVAADSLAGGVGGDAPQPQRRHDRRRAAPQAAGLQRAVPPRGLGRPARQQLSVSAVSRDAAEVITMTPPISSKQIRTTRNSTKRSLFACED